MKNAAKTLSALALAAAMTSSAHAAFENGQLVVIRVGNGISNSSNPNYIPFDSTYKTQPVSLLKYDVTGDTPVLLSTTPLPSYFTSTVDSNQFVLSGRGDDNDAKITLSSNGQYLVFGGYQENLGVGSSELNYVVTGSAPRVVGRVDANMNFTTKVLTDGSYGGLSVNSVATDDGQRFWMAGGNNAGDTGGLRFVANDSTSAVNVTTASFGLTSTATDSYRGLRMVGGNLYANTPSQTAFNQAAPAGARYRRGVYWMNLSGALPASSSPVASAATSIMSSNDSAAFDANGNYDGVNGAAKGEFYPKTDSVFLDLDGNGTPETAYGTGGKEEIQKWHLDTADGKWKRDMTVDLIKIPTSSEPLVYGDSEANALDAFVQGNIVNLFISTDLGIIRLQDKGWLGGIVNTDQISGTATSTGSNRFINISDFNNRYINLTAGDSYRFRGLVVVPEPTGLAMLGLGGLILGARRRKAR